MLGTDNPLLDTRTQQKPLHYPVLGKKLTPVHP